MHEMGHNLNLAHSGTDEGDYDDRSGVMVRKPFFLTRHDST